MSRIQALNPESASGKSKALLDQIAQKNGKAVNIQRVLAQSPAALQMYLGISNALRDGELDPKLRERIALVVSQENHCGYCLSAHTFLGERAGLSGDEMMAARRGEAEGERESAAVEFSRKMVRERANVTDQDLQKLRDAGFSEGEIVEIVANVVQNIFTNYINHVAETEIDFPLAPGL